MQDMSGKLERHALGVQNSLRHLACVKLRVDPCAMLTARQASNAVRVP